MAANNFFGYTAHSQATPAGGYNAGVARLDPTQPGATYPNPGAASVAPSVAVAAQPAGSGQFVAQSQPTAPPPQPPQATPFRSAVIAFQPQQNVSATTYVMAPPTAAATPVVTTVYPTSTYNAYPPLPQPQVYDANTKTSYYAQPPVSLNNFLREIESCLEAGNDLTDFF